MLCIPTHQQYSLDSSLSWWLIFPRPGFTCILRRETRRVSFHKKFAITKFSSFSHILYKEWAKKATRGKNETVKNAIKDKDIEIKKLNVSMQVLLRRSKI